MGIQSINQNNYNNSDNIGKFGQLVSWAASSIQELYTSSGMGEEDVPADDDIKWLTRTIGLELDGKC